MKNKFKILAALSISALTLTGCIDETVPEGGTVTAEQLGESSGSLVAALYGIPSQMSQYYYAVGSSYAYQYDMGYPGIMIMTAELMGDLQPGYYGYDWFWPLNACLGMQDNGGYAAVPWYTLYGYVKAANSIIGLIDPETADATSLGYLGSAYAYRAFNYYWLTVLYEPVDNIYTDCSKVLGLTVPIVDENTTEETAKNNPRVSHDEMIKFILSDLDKAEKYLDGFVPDSKLFPDLSVVYGIKAKVYMWDEDYANAAKYARMAINASGATPLTETQWLDVTTGFNQANQAWMWYITYTAENMANLCNFTGQMASESDWSYADLYYPCIAASLYNKIDSKDFRKHAFVDPARYDYYDYQTCRGTDFITDLEYDYVSLKFRCVSGNYETYSIGGASDVPVMRIEEMYLIEAYATGASQGVGAGVALLNSFMQNYRQPKYQFAAEDLREFELEVLDQMRIEFWGEGEAFPIAKILKPDVIQNYDGTNTPINEMKINCKGIKPNWNMVIPYNETQNNVALKDLNNPNPSQTVAYPTAIGQFAPGLGESTDDGQTSSK